MTKASFAEDVTDAIMALADKDSEGKPVANAKKMEAFVKAALDYVTTSANGISPVKTTVAAAEGA